MPQSIPYYFSIISPWAYILATPNSTRIAARHGLAIDYRPVSLSQLFPETGGLPLAKRHPSRQRYRLIELQRWRERRDIPLVLRPRYWPFDPSLADRLVIAIAESGADVEAYLPFISRAAWAEQQDVADKGDACRHSRARQVRSGSSRGGWQRNDHRTLRAQSRRRTFRRRIWIADLYFERRKFLGPGSPRHARRGDRQRPQTFFRRSVMIERSLE